MKKISWIVIIFIGLGGLTLFSSSHPDGLMRVAEQYEFAHLQKQPLWTTVFQDYTWNGSSAKWTSIVASFAGSGLVLLLLLYGLRWLAHGKK